VRDTLVRQRTQLVNTVRAQVKTVGMQLRRCTTATFHKMAHESMSDDLLTLLGPLVDTIEHLTLKISECDRLIEELCREVYPETETVRQVHGVGGVTGLTFVLTIDDPHRFKRSRDVAAYLGLVPRRDQSGDVDRQLSITKQGDSFLPRQLVQSAQYILGPLAKDSDLHRWGLELASRGGRRGYRRAVVAVARKLAVLLHRLWITGGVYEPLRAEAQA